MAEMVKIDCDEVFLYGHIKFTLDMFNEVCKLYEGQNVVQSAHSVLTPLGLLSLSCDSGARLQFITGMGFRFRDDKIKAFTNETERLKSIRSGDFRMTKKVYISARFRPCERFIDLCENVFDAEIEIIDFENGEEATNKFNNLVIERTNNCIKELIHPSLCNPQTQAILMNTVYFKGAWKNKFSLLDINDQDYYLQKGLTVNMPYMYTKSNCLFYACQNLRAKLLQISTEGEELHFLFIQPNHIADFPRLGMKLKKQVLLNAAVSKMTPNCMSIHLPKFTCETSVDLPVAFDEMNIRTLFLCAATARLVNFLEDQNELYVTEGKHKATIDIHENGIEIAAGNVFSTPETSTLPPVEPGSMLECRSPFYFAIRTNNSVLFWGKFVGNKQTNEQPEEKKEEEHEEQHEKLEVVL